MVGQWAAQTLWWRGAKVCLLGHHDNRLDLFAGRNNPVHAGKAAINTSGSGWEDALRGVLQEEKVQVVVDTAGSVEAIRQLLPYMKRFSHLVSAGFYGTDDLVSLQAFRNAEASIDLVSGWQPDRIDATLELVSRGVLETIPLITHRFAASEAAAAWRLIESKGDDVLGVLLDWN
jgi:threonine dehydrogenase-like Zn-dependent dehydrogenase